MAMPVARRPRSLCTDPLPGIARARQSAGEFLLDHRLDETAHLRAKAILDRIEPAVEKQLLGGADLSRRDIARHGVVSTPALQRRNQQGCEPGDYATPNSNHLRDGTPADSILLSSSRPRRSARSCWPALPPPLAVRSAPASPGSTDWLWPP